MFSLESWILAFGLFFHIIDMIGIITTKKEINNLKTKKEINNLKTVASIHEIFDNNNYVVKFDTRAHDHKVPYTIYDIFPINDSGKRHIIRLTILEPNLTIIIDGLNKEYHVSGTEQLNKIENVAKKLSIKELVINDGSSIEIIDNFGKSQNVQLGPLNILSCGQTWYSKMGYKVGNQEEVDCHNLEIIEKPFYSLYEKLSKDNLVKIDNLEHFYFKNYWNKSIKDFFGDFKIGIKTRVFNHFLLKLIIDLINCIVDDKIIKFPDEHEALIKRLDF